MRPALQALVEPLPGPGSRAFGRGSRWATARVPENPYRLVKSIQRPAPVLRSLESSRRSPCDRGWRASTHWLVTR
jgi:hypothetical protein